MKKHHKLLLALAIFTIVAGGLWGWLRTKTPSENAAEGFSASPLRDQKAVPIQSSATQPQVGKAPDAVGAAPRKFIDITASERLDILDQIKATDADKLFQLFLDAGRIEHDPMKQSMLESKLVGAMMERKYSSEFVEKMRRFVMDKSNSELERGSITSTFASVRTKESTEFVLWVLANETDPELRASVIGTIRGLGGSQPYLPAMIEPLWRDSKDPDLLSAVAEAMAREAAPSSIELLLAAAGALGGQDDMRGMAASWAMTKIYKVDAVPPLESALKNTPPGSRMNEIALSSLSQLPDQGAAQAVISWLQTADSRAAPQVSSWIGSTNAKSNQKAVESALNPSVRFRSEENRQAIRAALAVQRAGTIFIGPNKQ